ncbi:MAG: acyltransferase family protein [Clostridia bacterium]|nr:acyltransferase family protein [Clostridia bacterium]
MKQRIYYLDFLRSFAILMVLALHSISEYIVNPAIYGTTSWYVYLFVNAVSRTGVPIFLMISGCLILSSEHTKNFRLFYKKSFTRIVVPLMFWNVAYYAYKCVRGYIGFNIITLISDFLNAGTEYHLWYLYTLIGIYLIAPFLKKLVDCCTQRQQIWLLFLMLLCTTIRPFINTVTPVYIYMFDALFNGYIAFFFMGYVLSKIKINYKIVITFSVIGISGMLMSVIFHHVQSSANGINLIFNSGYSLCHCALAAGIFVISKHIFDQKNPLKRIWTVLSKYSFGIYLVHVIVIDLLLNFFMIDSSPVVSSAYIFIISSVVSLIISFVFGKIKYIRNIIGF